jgi:hypothetical protein
MYLQAHLLSLGLKLAPEDAKGIAQLASVAQGIVSTSVKLEQIKAESERKAASAEELRAALRAYAEARGVA